MKVTRNFWFFVLLLGPVSGASRSGNWVRTSTADAHPLAADAARTYARQCSSCHGRDGHGRTRKGRQTHARDLTDGGWQDDVSDERLFNSINNGRGKMPSFRKKLSENDVDALVAYIRRLKR